MIKFDNTLSQDIVKSLLIYNPDTGVFTRRVTSGCKVAGSTENRVKRCGSNEYIVINVLNKARKAHRLAWLYVYGKYPESCIDHINGDGTDNRLCNLREADHTRNNRNRHKQRNNTSGVVGVRLLACGKWESSIRVDGRLIYLGRHPDKFDAVASRKSAESRYGFGD